MHKIYIRVSGSSQIDRRFARCNFVDHSAKQSLLSVTFDEITLLTTTMFTKNTTLDKGQSAAVYS
jgi:hypothetical protein